MTIEKGQQGERVMTIEKGQQGERVMTINAWRKTLTGFCATLTALTVMTVAAVAQPRTVSKTTTRGQSKVTTSKLSGTVVQVEGNQLLVRMSSGELRHFTPPPDRRYIVDGKELRLSELKPGTTLNATITTTNTPVTERTVQSATGRVWYAAGTSVIIRYPNGEHRRYVIKDSDGIKFRDSAGKEMTVFDLRKGMNISATKITEEPRTVFATNTVVTGSAPRAQLAQAQPARAPASPAASPAPRPAPRPAPARAPAPAPAQLPKTGSPLPLAGLLGLLFISASFGIRRFRRS